MTEFKAPTFLVRFSPVEEEVYRKVYTPDQKLCGIPRLHYFESDSLFSIVDRIEKEENGQIFIFCIWNSKKDSWDTTTSAQLRELNREDYYVKRPV